MTTQPISRQPPGGSGQRSSTYERIKEGILDGTLLPGSPLVEAQLAEWCGVSRTPVREALTRLQQDGIVERDERGLVVRQRSPEEILDIYEVRVVLEATAARMAAERHTTFDRVRLERLLRAAEQADPTNSDELVRCNKEFHEGVWAAGHDDALKDLLTRLNLHLVRYPATTLAHPGRWEQALQEHRAVVEAILDRDAGKADEIARAHFVEARDIRLKLWEDETY